MVNTAILCKSGHLILFLAKVTIFLQIDLPTPMRVGIGEHKFSVQIWIFYLFHSASNLGGKLIPHPTKTTLGVDKHVFSTNLIISFSS